MKVSKKGSVLTIEIELEEKGHVSKTGKSTILASSNGYQWFDDLGLGVSVNVLKSKRVK